MDQYSSKFTTTEVREALKSVKAGKAPGLDGIHPEFLLHCGKYAKQWLAEFYSNIMATGNIPQKMKNSKIIALLKPGKPSDQPKSYRPIALLSVIYKLLERLLYNRLSPKILESIPIEQSGFRPNRSCTDQVLSLTTHIEAGYQKKQKTSVAFIDLSAAYDTVWRQGLLYKLIQIIPCSNIIRLVDNMLAGRAFQVITGEQMSSTKVLNNGLPQGSVLAPLLFNLYTSDIPNTQSRKFGYADDWAIAAQHSSFEATEDTLCSDLMLLGGYFRKWRLQPNPTKTEVSCFHLCNHSAKRELNVIFEGKRISHNNYPKYLGVILDRTLSYKEHLVKTAEKMRTRNNIIHKLCGTTWGSTASTLRTSAVGLVYSVAEYCAPVWINSPHTSRIDVVLNDTMRTISGTIKSTPTIWLPTLSHIPPPEMRRKNALLSEFNKINNNPQLPIHNDIADLERRRLKSRRPALLSAKEMMNSNFDVDNLWKQHWQEHCPPKCQSFMTTEKPPGFNQPRKVWTTLNRIRTGHGRSADALYKWGKIPTPNCDCGAEKQTVRHIVEECPVRAYKGTFKDFLDATEEAIDYIKCLDVNL